MAALNPNIELKIQLRDSDESEIEHYLTNGGKSIPKLIVRDNQGNDLFIWGPRPEGCQQVYLEQRKNNTPIADEKIAIQKWYNDDKGASVQKEICQLISELD
jgi:hypothetical protein